jgi:bacterioferritin
MSDTQELIDRLNEALSWELAATIQYGHHAAMVTGPHREYLEEFFLEGSEEGREHAEKANNKIVALGGTPTVEPARIREAGDVDDMLEASLALELDALEAWEAALEIGEVANKGTKFWLEDHVAEEQEHVDELRLLADEISHGGGAELDAPAAQSG